MGFGRLALATLLCASMAIAVEVKVCMPFSEATDTDSEAKTECESNLNGARTSASLQNVDQFVCQYGDSEEGCMQSIEDGINDIATFGGDQLYRAHRDHGLIAYVAEEYNSDGGPINKYYAVAVVKAGQCKEREGGDLSTLLDLRGKKSCHTGYRKVAGWMLPVGYMINTGLVEAQRDQAVSQSTAVDAVSMKEFFGDMCAPGMAPEGPKFDDSDGNVTVVEDEEMCAGCQGDDKCSLDPSKNEYAGSLGAFQCMVDGGDVAFVKHTTFDDWNSAKGGGNSKEDYRLLCFRGCQPLEQYKKCNLGEAPATALMGRADWKVSNAGRDVISLFNGNDQLLGKTQDLGGKEDFLFSSSAKSLARIENTVPFEGTTEAFFKSYDQFEAIHALDKVKVCMPFEDPDGANRRECEEALNEFAPSLQAPDFLNTLLPVSFVCTARGTEEECMRAVKNGAARGGDDLVVLGGNQMYTAHKYYGLNAIVAERYSQLSGDPLNAYYSVAVVKANKCAAESDTGIFSSLENLQGVQACHTGYRKSSGWMLPVGRLIDEEIMPVLKDEALEQGVSVDAASVVGFFQEGGVCAPGTTVEGPAEGGEEYAPLCAQGCTSEETPIEESNRCKGNPDNPYYGYQGAFQCMVDKEAAGETAVAFVKHTTYDDYKDEAQWGSKNQYRVLCDTGCKPLDEYKSCNLGEAPARAMMSTDKFANSDLGKNVINYATGEKGGPNFLEGTKGINGREDFLWQSEVEDLEKVTGSFEGSSNSFFQSYNQFDKVRTLGQETVRFCAPFPVSDKPRFVSRCEEYLSNFNRDNLKWTCVVGGDSQTCMKLVKDGEAEVTKFGGNQLYTAYSEFGLEPVVAEIYEGTDKASYKAVAVMRKQDCEQLEQNLAPNAHPFSGLQGKKSCHTGYRKTAGWVLPVGTLFDLQLLPQPKEVPEGIRADAAAVVQFFDGVCAPGVTDEGPAIPQEEGGEGGPFQKLCALCEDKQRCDKDDAYAGYEGALQCLINEEGDVAWVKHTTPLTRLPSEREELRLLCPRTGSSTASTCREVERWEDCSYADAPGHAWVGRPNWHTTVAGKATVESLEEASKDTFFLAFTTFDDFEDFPLQSSALRLQGVENPNNFESYFGSEAFRAFSQVRGFDQEEDQSGEKKGLSDGEIAGIVVACVVGVPLIILIIVFIVRKRRGGDMSMDISMPKLKNPFRRTAPPNVGEGYKVYNPTMDFNGGRMPTGPADAVKV